MKKTIIFVLMFVLVMPVVIHAETTHAGSLDGNTAYKGIVKINLFGTNEDGWITKLSSGSGSIIDPNGLILTNYHVVTEMEELDESAKTVAYQVCLTTDRDKEPDCSYTARYIASDKDMDVALLRIQGISGLSGLSTFPYLNMAASSIDSGSAMKVYGYPGIGGDTITISEGVVSGKSTKYNLNWIKTDADMSFGNSGGAGIDSAGNIIGIPTSGRSDMLGSVGYLVDIASISAWISSNKSKNAVASPLELRLSDFAKKQKALETSDEFAISYPSFKMEKPSAWKYDYDSENYIGIENENDEDSGYLTVEISKFEFPVEAAYLDYVFNFWNMDMLPVISIVKVENVNIGGKAGKLFTYSFSGEISKQYLVANGNHVFILEYSNGKDDKDKALVTEIINSIELGAYTPVYQNLKSYQNASPSFSVSFSGGDWIGIKQESKSSPVGFVDTSTKKMHGGISMEKLDDDNEALSNNEKYNMNLEEIEGLVNMMSRLDIKLEVNNAQSYVDIGEINDAIMLEVWMTGKQGVAFRGRDYTFRHDGIMYNIGFKTFGDVPFTPYEAKIKQILSTFVLSGYKPAVITEEILTYKPAAAGTQTNDDGLGISIEDDSLNLLLGDGLGVSASNGGVSVNAGGVSVNTSNGVSVRAGDGLAVEIGVKDETMYNRLRGRIMIKVGDAGKAYYVHPQSQSMYYLGRPDDAYSVMREQGTGIKSIDLEKIPVGLDGLQGKDTDTDGLPDSFEDAIGTDKTKKDTDGDSYGDKSELLNGYSPKARGMKLNLDGDFSSKKKGVIFLQVESRGEAWYVNPNDGKRYFLGRPQDAFMVMRNLGLGISNTDFDKMD